MIEKDALVRIRTQDAKGLVTITSIHRVVDITQNDGYLIIDIEPATIRQDVPHAR